MRDLYTRFMEWVMPFLLTNWQFFLIVVGCCFCWGQSSAGNGAAILRVKMRGAFVPPFIAILTRCFMAPYMRRLGVTLLAT